MESIVIPFIILLVLFIVAIAVFALVFWIWMIIDCAKRDFKKDNDKVIWILVIVLLQVLGAIIYYFAIKMSNRK